MSAPKAGVRAVADRVLQHYFDQLADRMTNEIRQSRSDLEATVRHVARTEAWAAAQDTRESLQESIYERARDNADRALTELRAGLAETQLKSDQRHREALQDIDETRGALQRDVARAEDELRGAFQRELMSTRDELRGDFQRELASARDELRGAFQRELMSTRDELRGDFQRELMSTRDELRGDFQRELASARDDIRGTVELLRDAFDDFRAKVEPRVVGVEKRMDALELRMMTFQSLQKDFADLRSRDMASVRQEAATLREDVRRDIVELSRMLRMQGDAADQVAEALGRTIARLSAELEVLAPAVEDLGAFREAVHQPV